MKSYNQLIESLLEAWPGTPEYNKKHGAAKGMTGATRGARHDIEKKDGVTKVTRRYNKDGESEEPANRETGGAPVKRGRGRPPGKYGSYKKKVKESLDIIDSMETEEEVMSFLESLDHEDLMDVLDAMNESDEEDDDDEEAVEEGVKSAPRGSAMLYKAGKKAVSNIKKKEAEEKPAPKTESVETQPIAEGLSVDSLASFITKQIKE